MEDETLIVIIKALKCIPKDTPVTYGSLVGIFEGVQEIQKSQQPPLVTPAWIVEHNKQFR